MCYLPRSSWAILAMLFSIFGVAQTVSAAPLPAGVLSSMRAPTQVLVYSLERTPSRRFNFHGTRILTVAIIKDKDLQQRVLQTVRKQMEAARWEAVCFFPRHGLRIIDGKTVHDFVICYECHRVDLYSTGQRVRHLQIDGKQSFLDEILAPFKKPVAAK